MLLNFMCFQQFVASLTGIEVSVIVISTSIIFCGNKRVFTLTPIPT